MNSSFRVLLNRSRQPLREEAIIRVLCNLLLSSSLKRLCQRIMPCYNLIKEISNRDLLRFRKSKEGINVMSMLKELRLCIRIGTA